MKEKILTTPRSYGKGMPELFEQLEAAGYEVVKNTTGGILEKEAMKEMLADCVGVIVGVDPLDAEVLAAAPKLRAIAKYGVGVDNIDMDYCKEHGIKVSRTVGANSEAVADYAMALMLAVARKVPEIDRKCRERNWGKITTRDVSHATLGLFGLGAIGRHVALRAKGFGMKVIAYDQYQNPSLDFVTYVTMDELLAQSDLISLHCPLTDETYHLISRETIQKMKDGVILVNTSRGGLVKTDDLIEGIRARKFSAVGLDVYEEEKKNVFEDRSDEILESSVTARLLSFPNVVITSHQGFFTQEALAAISQTTLSNAMAYVNKEASINEVE